MSDGPYSYSEPPPEAYQLLREAWRRSGARGKIVIGRVSRPGIRYYARIHNETVVILTPELGLRVVTTPHGDMEPEGWEITERGPAPSWSEPKRFEPLPVPEFAAQRES